MTMAWSWETLGWDGAQMLKRVCVCVCGGGGYVGVCEGWLHHEIIPANLWEYQSIWKIDSVALKFWTTCCVAFFFFIGLTLKMTFFCPLSSLISSEADEKLIRTCSPPAVCWISHTHIFFLVFFLWALLTYSALHHSKKKQACAHSVT